jgi:hypothetical protein
MKIRYIAFKWYVDASIDAVKPVMEQVGLRPGKNHLWNRSVGEHTLQVEYRVRMSSKERSYFWIRFFHAKEAPTDKGALDRVLADWFFTMNRHFTTYVNWLQVALDIDEFRSPYGFTESSPKIWTKADKQNRFSFYPVLDHYNYEVKNEDIRKSIQHHRFSNWIDELKHNLLGHERPDDQIRFDLVV